MKKKKPIKLMIIMLAVLLITGCQTTLTDKEKKAVKNPETGQSLTKNILCQPTNEKTIELYKENGVKIEKLPECKNFKLTSGKYEGLWTSLFVKPLAFCILALGTKVGSFAISIILITIIIKLICFPLTKKMALQSEMMKKASPELERIKKKYENKTDQESMMKQNQEMLMVYKKYNFNPFSSCLVSFLQLPLFFAFLEAINRVPAIFEENFIGFQLGTTPIIGISSSTFYVYIILMIIMAATTVLTFKMTANNQDPSTKMMPLMMSVMIIITGLVMPTALGIYWTVGNIFTICQNIIVRKGMDKNGKK